jgi:hypothetical protein
MDQLRRCMKEGETLADLKDALLNLQRMGEHFHVNAALQERNEPQPRPAQLRVIAVRNLRWTSPRTITKAL